jgi:hypothetical protein
MSQAVAMLREQVVAEACPVCGAVLDDWTVNAEMDDEHLPRNEWPTPQDTGRRFVDFSYSCGHRGRMTIETPAYMEAVT